MIERFGKYHRTAGPGLSVAIPLLEKVAYKRSLKESTLAIHPMTAITKDNVHVSLDGAVYVKCHDTYAASYEIGEPEDAIRILAQSCMRKEVGNLELDELFLEREKLNAAICSALDQATEPWGIRALRYEIADITVNHHTREAMEKQSNAERLRRAEVLESEGYRQRLINQSEGEKQQAINEASGAAEATRLRASADAEQIRLLAEAQAAATRARRRRRDGRRPPRRRRRRGQPGRPRRDGAAARREVRRRTRRDGEAVEARDRPRPAERRERRARDGDGRLRPGGGAHEGRGGAPAARGGGRLVR